MDEAVQELRRAWLELLDQLADAFHVDAILDWLNRGLASLTIRRWE